MPQLLHTVVQEVVVRVQVAAIAQVVLLFPEVPVQALGQVVVREVAAEVPAQVLQEDLPGREEVEEGNKLPEFNL